MPILNLTELARGDVRVDGEISPEDPLWEGSAAVLSEPLRVELRAQAVGEGVLVRGRMWTRLAPECRRCLVEVPSAVDEEVTLLFEPLRGDEAEDLEGEIYPLPDRGDRLELGPALREELLLRIPEFVLCSADCRGLCPSCGANLNETECDCVPGEDAGPWDALKKIDFD